MLPLLIWIVIKFLILQIDNPYEGRPPEEWYEGPSIFLWYFGWFFLLFALIGFLILVMYTKYGREVSIRLSVITIVVSSTFLGLAFHFLLLSFGY